MSKLFNELSRLRVKRKKGSNVRDRNYPKLGIRKMEVESGDPKVRDSQSFFQRM